MTEYVRPNEMLDVQASLESCADNLARTRELDRIKDYPEQQPVFAQFLSRPPGGFLDGFTGQVEHETQRRDLIDCQRRLPPRFALRVHKLGLGDDPVPGVLGQPFRRKQVNPAPAE